MYGRVANNEISVTAVEMSQNNPLRTPSTYLGHWCIFLIPKSITSVVPYFLGIRHPTYVQLSCYMPRRTTRYLEQGQERVPELGSRSAPQQVLIIGQSAEGRTDVVHVLVLCRSPMPCWAATLLFKVTPEESSQTSSSDAAGYSAMLGSRLQRCSPLNVTPISSAAAVKTRRVGVRVSCPTSPWQ